SCGRGQVWGPRIAGRVHCRMRIFGARRATQGADLDALRDFSRDVVLEAAGAVAARLGTRSRRQMPRTGSMSPSACQEEPFPSVSILSAHAIITRRSERARTARGMRGAGARFMESDARALRVRRGELTRNAYAALFADVALKRARISFTSAAMS